VWRDDDVVKFEQGVLVIMLFRWFIVARFRIQYIDAGAGDMPALNGVIKGFFIV
jgi:hypothetical protein